MFLGISLTFATMTVFGQSREYHPRLVRAIEALREAKAYMEEAPHDFGHKREAIRACEEAIRQLELAQGYRPRER
jgi:hypothetical protein